jgi:hypothetical protein
MGGPDSGRGGLGCPCDRSRGIGYPACGTGCMRRPRC